MMPSSSLAYSYIDAHSFNLRGGQACIHQVWTVPVSQQSDTPLGAGAQIGKTGYVLFAKAFAPTASELQESLEAVIDKVTTAHAGKGYVAIKVWSSYCSDGTCKGMNYNVYEYEGIPPAGTKGAAAIGAAAAKLSAANPPPFVNFVADTSCATTTPIASTPTMSKWGMGILLIVAVICGIGIGVVGVWRMFFN